MKSLLAIAVTGVAMAPCLWDSDTLDTELRGLPDAFDLIVGKWHRHSDAYYRDRIARLEDKADKALQDYDDLAVAWEHLGQRDRAIACMAEKAVALAATPDEEHQYRYHANLGTFHAHRGEFDNALRELRKAVAINPEAHFGREVFQIELIEYVAAAKRDPKLWTTRSGLRHAGYYMSFAIGGGAIHSDPETYRDYPGWRGKRVLDWDKAYKALAGMLRFGGLEGAELYRGLAELYLTKEHLNLAWWAYGRAIERGHPAKDNLARVRKSIERHWDEARRHNNTGHVNPTDDDYRKKRREADAWLARFQNAEAAAVERGEDVRSDGALEKLLEFANGTSHSDAANGDDSSGWLPITLLATGSACLLLFVFRKRRR